MISTAETMVVQALAELLPQTDTGEALPDSAASGNLVSALGYFIPDVLRELHPEWEHLCFDDVYLHEALKLGEREALIFGLADFLDDFQLAPVYARLQVSKSSHCVSWLECRVGEAGPQGMQRWPNRPAIEKQLYRLAGKQNQIDWAYQVTYGEKD
ncbi:hypothetical protein FYZ48_17870 [Gimesia chilikensis]|uniref:hypothetical protein n=1 Tax=Gimesia chilikensis TaxID=2605989 RepID=UPI0011ED6704|nr:hypothetical protein [Gimesia chilikensis]KAA0135997.1 hypothetical protein FYZ48_17870 [Gimesia chilikensis]